MGTAVEKSEIILFEMTEKYRQSDNCRKELTYVCKRKKRMIGLRLLYIDFTKTAFDISYQNLLREIESGI